MPRNRAESEGVLVVRRTIAAPVAAVYRAWTDPDQVMQWSWGSMHDTIALTLDCRPGGSWHHEIRNRENGERWTFDGVFQEVIPQRRLVHTFFWTSEKGVEEGTSLVAIDFLSPSPERTEVVITHQRLGTASREGTRQGWEDILATVDGMVTQPRMVPKS